MSDIKATRSHAEVAQALLLAEARAWRHLLEAIRDSQEYADTLPARRAYEQARKDVNAALERRSS